MQNCVASPYFATLTELYKPLLQQDEFKVGDTVADCGRELFDPLEAHWPVLNEISMMFIDKGELRIAVSFPEHPEKIYWETPAQLTEPVNELDGIKVGQLVSRYAGNNLSFSRVQMLIPELPGKTCWARALLKDDGTNTSLFWVLEGNLNPHHIVLQ